MSDKSLLAGAVLRVAKELLLLLGVAKELLLLLAVAKELLLLLEVAKELLLLLEVAKELVLAGAVLEVSTRSSRVRSGRRGAALSRGARHNVVTDD